MPSQLLFHMSSSISPPVASCLSNCSLCPPGNSRCTKARGQIVFPVMSLLSFFSCDGRGNAATGNGPTGTGISHCATFTACYPSVRRESRVSLCDLYSLVISSLIKCSEFFLTSLFRLISSLLQCVVGGLHIHVLVFWSLNIFVHTFHVVFHWSIIKYHLDKQRWRWDGVYCRNECHFSVISVSTCQIASLLQTHSCLLFQRLFC